MILCVTLNPVLDTTFFVDEMRPIYRTEAQRVTYVAGGKGDNVARALGILGEPAHALVALGGDTGRHVASLLAAEGIAATPAWMSGETRLQITVIDRVFEQRAFYAPAAPFTADDQAEFRRRFEDLLPGADAVCLSGSAPDAVGCRACAGAFGLGARLWPADAARQLRRGAEAGSDRGTTHHQGQSGRG